MCGTSGSQNLLGSLWAVGNEAETVLVSNKTKIPLHFRGTSSSPVSSYASKIFAESRFNCLKQTPKT